MLVECGFAKVTTSEGVEYSFTPSLGRIAALGTPQEIVKLYAGLHGASAAKDAAYVLASLCDQEDPTPLVGWIDEDGAHPGLMPESEQIIIARHLMQHGIAGKAKPSNKGDGKFSDKFEAAEYIAAARVHLGLSSADAEALSMTEFQTMFEMKFPSKADGKRDVPTREEYEASMKAIEGRRNG
jgi:hypothetical protein